MLQYLRMTRHSSPQTRRGKPVGRDEERPSRAPLWTIDQLARSAGTTTRNIRAFQTAGVLARPHLNGRTGLYDAGHQARLAAVLRLQEEGFTLGSLRRLFSAWEQGLSLGAALGLEASAEASTLSARRPDSDEKMYPFGEWPTDRSGRALWLLPSEFLGGGRRAS